MRIQLVPALAALLTVAARAAAAEGEESPPPPVALVGARILTVSGPPIERGTLVLSGGKVSAVGADVLVPEGVRTVDVSGRTLCPGFVDPASRLGLEGADRDRPAGSPEVLSAEGVDLRDPAFEDALGAGVTSLLVAPGSGRGAFAGRACLVKPRPGGGNLARMAAREGPLKVAMGPPSGGSSVDRAAALAGLRQRFQAVRDGLEAERRYAVALREFLEGAAEYAALGDTVEEGALPAAVLDRLRRLDPEAREAARKALRARLGLKDPAKPPTVPKRPREPRPSPADEVLRGALRGDVPVRFEAHAVEDVRAAAALAREFGLRGSVEGCGEAAAVAPDLAAAGLRAVCWPLLAPVDDGTPTGAAVPGLLSAAGVGAAVGTGGAGPGAVRHLPFLAALAQGHGLDGDAALRAVTLEAARAAGFGERLGALAPGRDGDVLVLDGDPLAPGTRVLQVWIDGAEVPLPAAAGR